jgi:hypothetical protein
VSKKSSLSVESELFVFMERTKCPSQGEWTITLNERTENPFEWTIKLNEWTINLYEWTITLNEWTENVYASISL